MLNRKTLLCVLIAIIGIIFFTSQITLHLAHAQNQKFTPPNKKARVNAIGPVYRTPRQLKRALNDSDQFAPIPAPGSSDWLTQHRESGQTFHQFKLSAPNLPDGRRKRLYMLPIGDFPESGSPDLDKMKDFANAFFSLDVQFLPKQDLEGLPIKIRARGSQPRQLLSTDVLAWLESRLPSDAYCMIAITMEDLYPDEGWNFVFGQASLQNRVGVYSFARYSPAFYGDQSNSETESLMLLRSCKVLAHETGHMFGIKHCVHFHCLMNGSNHLEESDAQPIHMCPVCLRKLQSSTKFDVLDRYEKLLPISNAAGWKEETQWLTKRINYIKSE